METLKKSHTYEGVEIDDKTPPRRVSRRPRARLASRLPGFEGGVTSRLQHIEPHTTSGMSSEKQ